MTHIFVGAPPSGIQVIDSKSWSGTTSPVMQIPDGARPGDFLICAVVARGWNTNTAAPAGWSTLHTQVVGATRVFWYSKFYDPSDTPVTLTLTGSVNLALTIALRGVNADNQLNASNSSSGTNSSTVTAPTTTTTVPKTLVLRVAWLYNSLTDNAAMPSWSSPIASVGYGISGNSGSLSFGGAIKDVAGATGTEVAPVAPNSSGGIWGTLAIAPA